MDDLWTVTKGTQAWWRVTGNKISYSVLRTNDYWPKRLEGSVWLPYPGFQLSKVNCIPRTIYFFQIASMPWIYRDWQTDRQKERDRKEGQTGTGDVILDRMSNRKTERAKEKTTVRDSNSERGTGDATLLYQSDLPTTCSYYVSFVFVGIKAEIGIQFKQ